MAYKQKSPIPIKEGGTNATGILNIEGVLLYDGTRIISLEPGASGNVLTSNGPLIRPTFDAPAASGIVTITGSTGSVTGTSVSIEGTNSNIVTAGSGTAFTVALANSPSVSGSVTAGTGLVATTGGIVATGTSTINTSAADNSTSIGNNTGASPLVLNAGTSGIISTITNGPFTVATGTGTASISADATANAVNIATGAGAKVLTLGSTNTTSSVAIKAGTVGCTLATTNGSFTLTTGSGTINIGNEASLSRNIQIGNFINPGTLTITNGSGTTAFNSAGIMNIATSGSLALNIGASGRATTIASDTLTVTATTSISISANTSANTINIATGAGVKALTLGSTNTTSSVTINTGSGGITIPSFTTTGALVSTAAGLITDATASTSGYVLTSNGSGSAPSFQVLPSTTIVNQNSSSVTMVSKSIYIINNGASLVTLTLPASAALGDIFQIVGSGSGGWTVAQQSGQIIYFGNVNTTTGAGGSLASSNRYDQITFMCTIANTDFVVISSLGNITYV